MYACNEIDDLLGFKSPWDSIYKLRTLVSRCKTIPVDAEWCVLAINDGVINHTLPSLPISHLKDLPGTSGRSIVDVLLLQRSVRDHAFEVLSFKIGMSERVRSTMPAICSTPASYKASRATTADNAWRTEMTKADELFFEFIEGVLFSGSYLPVLKAAVKRHAGADAFMDQTGPL